MQFFSNVTSNKSDFGFIFEIPSLPSNHRTKNEDTANIRATASICTARSSSRESGCGFEDIVILPVQQVLQRSDYTLGSASIEALILAAKVIGFVSCSLFHSHVYGSPQSKLTNSAILTRSMGKHQIRYSSLQCEAYVN